MRYGYNHDLFWDSSLAEILEIVQARQQYEKEQLIVQASLTHKLADLIGISVGRLMDKNATYPTFEQVFPNFSETEQKTEDESWKLYKQRMMVYTANHNAKGGHKK